MDTSKQLKYFHNHKWDHIMNYFKLVIFDFILLLFVSPCLLGNYLLNQAVKLQMLVSHYQSNQ